MNNQNQMTMSLQSKTVNEALARSTVAAFCAELDPTVDQVNDIKTAVTEAVNNAIVHGYDGDDSSMITILTRIDNQLLYIEVKDNGVGIPNIEQARKPFFTTKPNQERSGMGFTVMESYMDSLDVVSDNSGTTVIMTKRLA